MGAVVTDERQAAEAGLADAWALAERGEPRSAVKAAERVRLAAFAAEDVPALEQVLALARRVYVDSEGKRQNEAGRLAFGARQNIRFLTRKQALAAGEVWVDPFPPEQLPAGPSVSALRETAGAAGAPIVFNRVVFRRLVLVAVLGALVGFVPLLIAGATDSDGWASLWVLTAYFGLGWLLPGGLTGLAVSEWAKGHQMRDSRVVSIGAGIGVGAVLLFSQAALADSFGIQLGSDSDTEPTPSLPNMLGSAAEQSVAASAAHEQRGDVVAVQCLSGACVVTFSEPSCQLWLRRLDGTNIPLGDPQRGKLGVLQGRTVKCRPYSP